MDIDLIRGILTAILLVLFCALCAFSFSSHRNHDHAAAARLALDEDEMKEDQS